jgi:hypothetical protein
MNMVMNLQVPLKALPLPPRIFYIIYATDKATLNQINFAYVSLKVNIRKMFLLHEDTKYQKLKQYTITKIGVYI